MSSLVNKRSAFNKQNVKESIMGWAFILPAVALFFLFVMLPIVIALVTGFSDFNGINSFGEWGFKNYREIFTTDIFKFKQSMLNLIVYIVLYVPLNIIISISLAMLVHKKNTANKYFRLAYYIPALTSGVAVAAVWSWMLNPSVGVINTILGKLSLPQPNWLNNKYLTMVTVTIVSLWSGTAANMVLYIAAIQGIDESLIEAAKIEGASRFKTVTKIIIPLLNPITYFVLTTVFIGAFQLYEQPLMLFGGNGPENSAITPIKAISGAANATYYGKASAMSSLLFVLVLLLTNVIQFINKKMTKETY